MALKVAITHDVDRVRKTFHYFTKTIRAIPKGDLKMIKYQFRSFFNFKNSYWTFDDLLLILNNYQIKSTFFFLNESIKFNPLNIKNWPLSLGRYSLRSIKLKNEIKRLKRCGHEIGVHGSYNSYNDLKLLKKEKFVLEEIIGEEIIGIRQHHLNLNVKTWELQQRAGFKYDSTWGLNRDFGIREGKVTPFKPFENEFLVVPMMIMDTPFVNCAKKWEKFEMLLRILEEKKGVLVLNWHTDSLNENEFPNFRNDLIKIIEILMSKNSTFHTLSEIYKEYQV